MAFWRFMVELGFEMELLDEGGSMCQDSFVRFLDGPSALSNQTSTPFTSISTPSWHPIHWKHFPARTSIVASKESTIRMAVSADEGKTPKTSGP